MINACYAADLRLVGRDQADVFGRNSGVQQGFDDGESDSSLAAVDGRPRRRVGRRAAERGGQQVRVEEDDGPRQVGPDHGHQPRPVGVPVGGVGPAGRR